MKLKKVRLLMNGIAIVFFAAISILVLAAGSQSASASPWLDRSHQIFFPQSGRASIEISQAFPVFWWNFVVLELKDDSSWPQAQQFCQDLKSLSPELLTNVECNQGLRDLQSFVVDWAQDLPLREDRPTNAQIREKFNAALAKASLPTGDHALLRILQADPMESWLDLKKLVEQRLKLRLDRKGGFFYDEETRRIVIPIQAAFPPGEIEKTQRLIDVFKKFGGQVTLIGPHGSTIRNQDQVAKDLHSVSLAGYVVLSIFGLLLLMLRRWRLLLLFPPVFVAVGVGAAATVLVFGSIHGLTVSLGAGIIGLALDYGFNAALNDQKRQTLTWRSNLLGIITSLVGLFILMTSSIPLLRQMMFFSSVGLVAGFIIFRFLLTHYPAIFIAKSFGIKFSPNALKTSVISVFILAAFAGVFFLRPDFDMKQFDFQERKSQAAADWLYKKLELRAPLFTVNSSATALETSQKEVNWARDEGIPVESLALYLPPEDIQKRHLSSWQSGGSAETETDLQKCVKALAFNETERKFFARFIETSLCGNLKPRSTTDQTAVRNYDRHLNSGDRWVTLWMPESDAQEQKLRDAQPEARSLREIVLTFPQTLARELSWMAPTSLVLVFLILLIYYRRIDLALIALVPFFSGLGLFTLAVILFKLQISFISVIALVMSFGFSFDYAVFAVDHYFNQTNLTEKENSGDGVWEAISSAACATMAGFAPLLFCKHPVLGHLGQALCVTTLGCYWGAIWGVPGFMDWLPRRNNLPGKLPKNYNDT